MSVTADVFPNAAKLQSHDEKDGAGADAMERPTLDEMASMLRNARAASDLLKSIAHENRLLILCILADGEKSVGELEVLLKLRQPSVSQQLARLRSDGLVATRREGKTIYYSLSSHEAGRVVRLLYDIYCR